MKINRGCQSWTEEMKQKGINRGIEAFVVDHLEDGLEEKRIAEKLQKRFLLDMLIILLKRWQCARLLSHRPDCAWFYWQFFFSQRNSFPQIERWF